METGQPKRILIFDGGFAGLSTAMELEKSLGRDPGGEITLVNRENLFCLLQCCTRSPPAIST